MDPIPIEPEPLPATLEELAARGAGTAPDVSAPPAATRSTLVSVGAAGALAGIVLVVALTSLRGAPIQTADAASSTTTPPATQPPPPVIAESGLAPTWTGQRTAVRGHDGSKTIAFELQAVRDVQVWASQVRPVLVVQCLSRATHAYVVLGTSAKFEDDAYRRTVRVQWDDEPEMVQQWQVSESAHELFASDGVAFVRRLATASRLRFGFTPFNAQPVTVDFAVQGFDHAGLVANTCGWRL